MPIKKQDVLTQLILQLQQQMAVAMSSAQAAYQGATDSESKSENKYDTRGLEASYLAHGQSKRVETLRSAVNRYQKLVQIAESQPPSTKTNEKIAQHDLVRLTNLAEQSIYFYIGFFGGGITLRIDDKEVKVITPEAPIAKQLVGQYLDDELTLSFGGTTQVWTIESIQ
jgi:transcription elongation GreA/GreB family factor